MEEFLLFWEYFYSSHEFWHLLPLDKKNLENKISPARLESLNVDHVHAQLLGIRQGIRKIRLTGEIMDQLHIEYLSNHSNITQVLNSIKDLIESGGGY